MKMATLVRYNGRHLGPRNGQLAKLLIMLEIDERVGAEIEFLEDGFHMAAHPEELQFVPECQGA